MPVQVPPFFQQVQPAVGSKFAAKSGNGSLKRSKTTALLPLNAVATWVQNCGANCASGIGFWHVAAVSEQPEPAPVYWPTLQCISTIGLMPLDTSRLT